MSEVPLQPSEWGRDTGANSWAYVVERLAACRPKSNDFAAKSCDNAIRSNPS